jgi:putative cell wall-binding protein
MLRTTAIAAAAPLHRALVGLLAVALAAAVLVAAPSPTAAQTADGPLTNLTRLDAGSFVEAGRQVAQVVYPDGARAAVLATTANFPDALSSSALAASVEGPVLFTDTDALPQGTRDELERLLEPGATVVLMGGIRAISQQVADAVRGLGFAVERVSGDTRIKTAAAAARLVGLPDDGRVLIARATGGGAAVDRTTGWVDSISCGAFAARSGTPILLTETDRLTATTAAAIRDLGARRAVICGGDAAVSEAVASTLRGSGVTVQRVAGATRVETAVAVATDLFGFASAAGRDLVVVNGYGERYGFGLAATQLAQPILVVDRDQPTRCDAADQAARATLCYLRTAGSNAADLTVVGSTAQVSQTVADAAAQVAGGERARPLPAPGGVRATAVDGNGSQLRVTWNAVTDPQGTLEAYAVYVGQEAVAPTRRGQVPAGTTTLVVDGLKPGTEHAVQVTTIDAAGRESARSTAARQTTAPLSPVGGFTATAGDQQVTLGWNASAESTVTEYRLERATTGFMGCGSYAALQNVAGRTTTTFTDATAQNGTAYCYRIRAFVGGFGGVTSEPSDAGPVTPSVNALTVAVTQPSGGTLRHGTTATIRYRISGGAGSRADYEVRIAVSTDGGTTYTPLVTKRHGVAGDEGTHPWEVPDVDSTDSTGVGGSPGGRVRVTVFEPEDGRPAEATSNPFAVRRAPATVTGAAAVPSGRAIALSWEANDERTVTGYRIERTVVSNLTSQSNTEQACSSVFGSTDGSYATVSGRTTTGFTDTQVTPNTGTTGQTRYCYRVRALRGSGPEGGFSSQTSATVAAVAAPGVALRTPENGETIRTNRGYEIRYTVTAPEGQPADRVVLDYCVDYNTSMFSTDNQEQRCRTGWQRIGNGPAGAGERSVVWSVPSTIVQGGSQQGAVRARIYAAPVAQQPDASPSNTSLRTGILFR